MYEDDIKNVVCNMLNEMHRDMLADIHDILWLNTIDVLKDARCVDEIKEIFEKNGFYCDGKHGFHPKNSPITQIKKIQKNFQKTLDKWKKL